MRSIFIVILIALQLFSSCCFKQSNSNIVEKMRLIHKDDWGISAIDYRWKKFNYYEQALYECGINIGKKNAIKANSYVVKFINGKDVIIDIMEFSEPESAKKLYEKVNPYAEKIRSTRRKDYEQLCQPIREWDFHYVYLNGEKIYFIGCINGNFVFKNGDISLESDEAFLHEAREIYLYIRNCLK